MTSSTALQVMLPIFAITAADSVVIVLEPKAVNDRLSVTLALLLVVVAYKYIVAGFLPIVPYLTLCDFYVLGCFFFLILLLVHNGIVGGLASYADQTRNNLFGVDDPDDAYYQSDDFARFVARCDLAIFGGIWAAFLLFHAIFILRVRQAYKEVHRVIDDEIIKHKFGNVDRFENDRR